MMRLMHTPIPSFYKQMEAAGKRVNPDTEVVVRGLENFQSAKLASWRMNCMRFLRRRGRRKSK